MPRFQFVPKHEVSEFFPRRTKYCFVPIVYNEGDRFRRQLTEMAPRSHLADILVAERRSTDGSTDTSFLRSLGVRALLTTDAKGGATAIRMALLYALNEGYHGVVLIDGNGKDGVEALEDYLIKLDEGYDFVQGSRFVIGGKHRNTPLARIIGIKYVMAPLAFIGTGFWYTDVMNGFRGYSRRYLLDPQVEPLRECFNHFNLQYYLSIRAPQLHFRVIEIPVSREYPASGPLPTKVVGFHSNLDALWKMVLTVLGKYNPP